MASSLLAGPSHICPPSLDGTSIQAPSVYHEGRPPRIPLGGAEGGALWQSGPAAVCALQWQDTAYSLASELSLFGLPTVFLVRPS